jgi:hypothetical protein
MLALALILQAYTAVSDDEVVEATVMDRRWQLVLDCLDTQQAPFSKGTLVAFRQRLIEAHLDRRLIERTIELANRNQGFGPRALRAALDSSPLWGAGRVEDTYNLVGHALKKVMRVVADQQGRELVEIAKEAGAEVVCETSLKAALDRDWDQVGQREEALSVVLKVLQAVETWVQTLPEQEASLALPPLQTARAASKSKMCRSMRRALPASSKESPRTDASASKMDRCAMDAKVAVCAWMETNAMCFTISTPVSSGRGRYPSQCPRSQCHRSGKPPIWSGKGLIERNCTSTGPL